MKLIRFGQWRNVLLIGKYAIKWPKPSQIAEGLRQNRREASYPKDARVCGVLFSLFGIVIVMPRADRAASCEDWENADYDKWKDVTTDFFWLNLAWFGDEMKLIDYGKQ